MAEGWKKNIQCRYFANGTCRKGDACHYLHQNQTAVRDISRLRTTARARCLYYQWGHCRYGQNCYFSHANVNSSNSCDSNQYMDSSSSSWRHTSENRNVPGPNKRIAWKRQDNNGDDSSGDEASENRLPNTEFVPSGNDNVSKRPEHSPQKSYSEVCKEMTTKGTGSPGNICPYLKRGQCKFGIQCNYAHGEICQFCRTACLNPHDKDQQKKHINECMRQHNMEKSLAIARSKEKTCGICFEVIMEKVPQEQRFGILPNCNHCFCLFCIRKWRQAKQFESKACPECRIQSDFVCPSPYWIDTKEDKEKLIKEYKKALSMKDCRYFKLGYGRCPFGNECFYLHAYSDGTKVDVGPPVPRRRLSTHREFVVYETRLSDLQNDMADMLLSLDELENLVVFWYDSDESDQSEHNFCHNLFHN